VGSKEGAESSAARTDESGLHHVQSFGFGISDDARHAGLPPERRPLTRHDVRNWTIGSVLGAASLASVIVLSRGHAQTPEQAEKRKDAVPAQIAAAAPRAAAMTPPPAIPLEALPIAREDDSAKKASAIAKNTTHPAATSVRAPARRAAKSTPIAAVKSSSRPVLRGAPNPKASGTTATVKQKVAP
jgi:hypothetical protein